jgi:hypothetical protein
LLSGVEAVGTQVAMSRTELDNLAIFGSILLDKVDWNRSRRSHRPTCEEMPDSFTPAHIEE